MKRPRMTEEEFLALKKAGRTFVENKPAQLPDDMQERQQGKIRHNTSQEDGFTFDSDSEHRRYGELKLLVAGGVIRNLKVKTKWGLVVNGKKVATYEDDFDYEERRGPDWEFVVEDVKSEWGTRDRVWRRTKKLMLACRGIDVQEVIR